MPSPAGHAVCGKKVAGPVVPGEAGNDRTGLPVGRHGGWPKPDRGLRKHYVLPLSRITRRFRSCFDLIRRFEIPVDVNDRIALNGLGEHLFDGLFVGMEEAPEGTLVTPGIDNEEFGNARHETV